MPNIALIPDRFTHYRYPIFKLLSDEEKSGLRVTVFADTNDVKEGLFRGVNAIDSSLCDLDINNGGIRWKRIYDFYLKGICIWQSDIIRLAFNHGYDVIVYWGEAHRISTWISAISARLIGKKVIFWSHGLYGNENFVKYWMRVTFYRLANAMLLYGKHAESLLKPILGSKSRLYVINNSLDYRTQDSIYKGLTSDSLHRLKAELFSPDDRVLCFIGRLEPRKKIYLLLQALSHLKTKSQLKESVKLLVIGDGTEASNLKQLTKQLGLENDVVFYGPCYDDHKTVPLLAMSDVLVSPGGVGLAAMHALISGTPVITHDDFSIQMPEAEVVKDGINGCFFNQDDELDLANNIIRCFQLLDSGDISRETCRDVIFKYYTPDFQLGVFQTVMKELNLA
ncbi:MAG: glycosyltransferase [Cyanobacteria bacterium P01_F01_bin.150]